MSDFFFARQNEDGTYGEPVRLTGVKIITVTSPVNDADAKKLLGSDMVTMEFKKV